MSGFVFPHGHKDHSPWFCSEEECVAIIESKERTVNEMFEGARVVKGDHGMAITNMQPSWVQQKDGAYISIVAAKQMNRAQRRKLGIKL